jgi:CheY-like chemotaxis protein
MAEPSSSILLVDEDAAFRYAASETLKDAGFTVSAVPDDREALEVLESAPSVDLLLTDV